MKKILSIAALALVALGFASCNQNTPAKVEAFKIDVSNVEARKATITVIPQDSNATYYWEIMPASEATKLSDDSVGAYFKDYMDEAIAYYAQYGVELTYADFLLQGEDSYEYTKLTPNTIYTVVAIALDANVVATGAPTRKTFQTLEVHEDPVPADMTFQFAVDGITFNSAAIAVAPSIDSATYFWNVFETAEIANMTDDALCQAIKANIEQQIEYYAMFGYDLTFADFLSKGPDAYEYDDLTATTAYTVVAFAMGTEGTTNGAVGKYNFQTIDIVATDSVEVDFHDALIYDYRDLDESFQIVASNADSTFLIYLNPFSLTFDGTFTAKDMDLSYSGIYDAEADESYDIEKAEFTGVATDKGADYTGWFIASDAVKYIFSFNATLVEDEPASAPAKARAAKKAPAAKKNHLMKKVNLDKKKGCQIVKEKAYSK